MKKAVALGLSEGYLKPEALYGMDDDTFFRKMTETPEEIASLVRESETPRKYTIISQTPFESDNALHRDLMDLELRHKHEKRLAGMIESRYPGLLPENHLVIDIPSRISFEVDLPIITEEGNIPFTDAGSVFSKPVVHGFTETLRHIRVIVPAYVARQGAPYGPGSLLPALTLPDSWKTEEAPEGSLKKEIPGGASSRGY